MSSKRSHCWCRPPVTCGRHKQVAFRQRSPGAISDSWSFTWFLRVQINSDEAAYPLCTLICQTDWWQTETSLSGTKKTHKAMISLCNGLICCRISLISTLGKVVCCDLKWVEFEMGGIHGIMISKYNAISNEGQIVEVPVITKIICY